MRRLARFSRRLAAAATLPSVGTAGLPDLFHLCDCAAVRRSALPRLRLRRLSATLGKRFTGAVLLSLFFGIAPGLAAEYVIKKIKLLPIESYSARAAVGQITVAADPYFSDEKAYTAFDVKDLNSRGYFPIHIIIQNSSRNTIRIPTRKVVLRTEDGSQFYATPATLLVEDIFGSGLSRAPDESRNRERPDGTVTGSPLVDFTTKELTNQDIYPGSILNGFLFFFLEEVTMGRLRTGQIVLPDLRNEDTREDLGTLVIFLSSASAAKNEP
jgi:hypothetical protein